jgi:hypothetical protein
MRFAKVKTLPRIVISQWKTIRKKLQLKLGESRSSFLDHLALPLDFTN